MMLAIPQKSAINEMAMVVPEGLDRVKRFKTLACLTAPFSATEMRGVPSQVSNLARAVEMGATYELRPYDAELKELQPVVRWAHSDAAIIGQAGTMAKANDGPVDIARAGEGPWADRYMTTASPSEYHAKGFRTERLT